MKIAVHLHLYYFNQLPKVLSYLKSLEGIDYDLFVTMVQENKDVEQQLKTFNPNTNIFVVENRGYDIGPFIDFLHHIDFKKYDYVLKVHTKSEDKSVFVRLNGYSLSTKLWVFLLWNSLLGSKKQLDKALSLFQDEKVGMVASSLCITKNKKNYNYLLPEINNELAKNGFNPVKKCSFVAGTMFLARTQLLKSFLKYQLMDFEATNGSVKDGALAHIVERMFSILILQQGYKIKGVRSHRHWVIVLRLFFKKIIRFLYQNKKSANGKRIVKVFGFRILKRHG